MSILIRNTFNCYSITQFLITKQNLSKSKKLFFLCNFGANTICNPMWFVQGYIRFFSLFSFSAMIENNPDPICFAQNNIFFESVNDIHSLNANINNIIIHDLDIKCLLLPIMTILIDNTHGLAQSRIVGIGFKISKNITYSKKKYIWFYLFLEFQFQKDSTILAFESFLAAVQLFIVQLMNKFWIVTKLCVQFCCSEIFKTHSLKPLVLDFHSK